MGRSTFGPILETGIEAGASDWHIRENSTVILRVDAQLVEISDFTVTPQFLDQALSEVVTERDMNKYIETGDADFAWSEDDVGRFRVNFHRQRGLRSLTFRHVKDKVPNLGALGLPPVLLDLAESERGIILVTGTTGSGKSTSMACMLQHMNAKFARHIITIEDPIEYIFEDSRSVFEQREVGLDCITFDSALVAALRQDPDVIVVGEMRRRESFDAALTAADTGHMVMSTLHTSNAAQSIQRILDFYPNEERREILMALANNLRAIVCQRLMPRAIGKGVVPALEVMINTGLIKKLLEEDRVNTLMQAIEASAGDGMMSFNQCLMGLVDEGKITEEVALSAATNPEALKMNLRGIFLGNDSVIIG
ncbi:MAG TPA: twitching motility protein [Lentisphaeria bacterium]|nr:twitching motility protein [Lentisphaeria bacterium]